MNKYDIYTSNIVVGVPYYNISTHMYQYYHVVHQRRNTAVLKYSCVEHFNSFFITSCKMSVKMLDLLIYCRLFIIILYFHQLSSNRFNIN